MRVITVEFVVLSKREDDLIVMQNVQFDFRQVLVMIAYCEDIYGSYCFQKSNNDHFHTYITCQ